MKFLIAIFLLIALPVFGAVPAYTSFRGTGGILITSNPPTGNITIDGSAIFTSSGTNATIATSTNGVLVAVASTNINFIMGTNVVLTATNIGSVTHIGIHAVGGQSSSMILSNLIGTVGRNVTNVISLSTSNATSKPITNSYAAGVLTVFGFEAGTNMILSMNASNIVINSAGGGGPGGDSGAIQFNQDDTFAGTNRLNYDRTNEILYVAGSVGIGTASPSYTLDVQAAIGSQRIVSTTAANETWLTFINNGAALIGLESGVPGTIVAGSSAYALLLASQYAYPVQLATDNAVRMTILPTSGNVGIGTVSPTNTLDVQGHTSLRSNLFLANLPTNGSPVAVLAVDAAGKVYETAVPSGGGGSTVAPPISSVQFNSNGVQQGSANFTFTNGQVYINNPGAVGSAQLRLENTTQAAAWDLVIDSNPETYFLGIRNGTTYTTVWEPGGNVGIGTTNPANRLDVEGRMAIGAAYSGTSIAPTDGLIVVGNTGLGTNTPGAQLHVRPATSGGNYFRVDDTNGTPRFQFRVYPTAPHIAGLWMGDVPAANYAMLSDGTNTEINGASSVLLEVAGFAMATVVTNGVGVNTSPTNMFDVNGHTSLRSNLFLANLPTNGSPIAFLATDAAGAVYETAVPAGGAASTPGGNSGAIQFNEGGAFAGTNMLVFDRTNNRVGIGLAAPPLTTLHVFQNANGTLATALLQGGATAGPSLELKDGAGTPNRWWIGSGVATTTDGNFFIYDARLGAIRFVVDTAGNVGIGTNAPLLKLDVAGGIRSHTVTASRMAAFHTDKTLTNSRTSSDLLQMFFDMGISNIVAADSGLVIRTNAGVLTISNTVAAAGGTTVSGSTGQIAFINIAGTGLTNANGGEAGAVNRPGFGYFPTGPHGGYGGLMVFANLPMGMLTVGHPNNGSDFETFATAMVLSNRYNGTGFKQELSKFEGVDVGAGSDPSSTLSTWATWSGATRTIAAEIRKDGMGFFSHGTMYHSNSLASTMPTAAELGPGGIWVGNSNASLVAIKSANGTTTAMTVLVP